MTRVYKILGGPGCGKTTEILNILGQKFREKLHDVLHARINGPKASTDAAFKSGSVLIEGEYAFFKFEKFYDRLRAKDWKYKEEKTGRIKLIF